MTRLVHASNGAGQELRERRGAWWGLIETANGRYDANFLRKNGGGPDKSGAAASPSQAQYHRCPGGSKVSSRRGLWNLGCIQERWF